MRASHQLLTVSFLNAGLAVDWQAAEIMPPQILVIRPYKFERTWVFDDEEVGLIREPFILGADTIIDLAVARFGIRNADSGFFLFFDAEPFLGAQMKLTWLGEAMGGNVYEWEGHEGWLCPAMGKYFAKAPPYIYAQLRE